MVFAHLQQGKLDQILMVRQQMIRLKQACWQLAFVSGHKTKTSIQMKFKCICDLMVCKPPQENNTG